MLILTAEQIFLSPGHAVGLRSNSHSHMLPGSGRGATSCRHRAGGGGGGWEPERGRRTPGGRQPALELQCECCPAWCGGNLRPSLEGLSWCPGSTEALTLGVGLLERVAGVHEAGGCVVLALQLQVQLGRLTEGASGSWNRRGWALPQSGAPGSGSHPDDA